MKRLFDLALAGVGLIVLWPLILLLAILIRLDSPGPGLFVQDRVGKAGRVFRCYKLRTMVANMDNRPTHLASATSVTAIGAVLRSTKMDELPQLWNIIKGEMSLVGPRPCLPQQVDLIEERRRRGVLSLMPGITGLAQVRGVDMSDPKFLASIDEEYLNNQSLRQDIVLIIKTVFKGAGRGDRTRGDQAR